MAVVAQARNHADSGPSFLTVCVRWAVFQHSCHSSFRICSTFISPTYRHYHAPHCHFLLVKPPGLCPWSLEFFFSEPDVNSFSEPVKSQEGGFRTLLWGLTRLSQLWVKVITVAAAATWAPRISLNSGFSSIQGSYIVQCSAVWVCLTASWELDSGVPGHMLHPVRLCSTCIPLGTLHGGLCHY